MTKSTFKKMILTAEQAETLEGILKARHFEHMYQAEKRGVSKAQKEMHIAEAMTIQEMLIGLADA